MNRGGVERWRRHDLLFRLHVSTPLRLFLLLLAVSPLLAFDSVQLKTTLTAPSSAKFAPQSVAADSSGRVWVTDSAQHQLLLFSAAGQVTQTIGKKGMAAGDFQSPQGVALDADGFVYVADSGNHRIQVFNPEGKFQDAFGEKGSEPGQFKEPTFIAVSQDGVVFVVDKQSSRIQLFSKDGVFYRALEIGYPIAGLTVDAAGRFYTINAKLRQIDGWTAAGQLWRTFSGVEPGVKGFAKPSAVAVDAAGMLLVADAGPMQFRMIEPAGRTSGTFGRLGSENGQFKSLDALAVVNDAVYVADRKLRRITVLAMIQPQKPAPLPPAPAMRLQVTRSEDLLMSADRLSWSPDGTLNLLLSESAQLVQVDPMARSTTTLSLAESLSMRKPTALTAAPSSGNIFIAEAGTGRLVKVDKDGKSLLEYPKVASPQALACSPQGVLYVVSGNEGRFHAYNHQGLHQFTAGAKGTEAGQLKNPVSIAWDTERLYVADPGNKKVSSFNSTGRFVRDIGAWGPEPLLAPRQVAVDREGNLFVLDVERRRIQIFDPQGVYLGGFGAPGKGPDAFKNLKQFSLNEHGELALADQDRIRMFRVVLAPAAPAQLTATPGEGYVSLKWDAVKTRFPVKYLVYRRAPTGENTKVKESVDTTLVDDTLTPGTTYAYTVVAQSVQDAVSVPSPAVSAMAQAVTSGPRLEIISADIEDVFSAHYKYYRRSPLGYVRIKNNSLPPVQKIKVSFAIQGFMDYPTEVDISELRSMEEKNIPLLATFNNRILEVTETTPIQAQIRLSYYSGDQELSVVRNVPFKLHSRNTIRWDKKERFAAFVTPNDAAVVDFTRAMAVPLMDARRASPVAGPVATAWSVFSGLSTYGMSYLPRPNNPYDRVSLDSSTVDTLQFARETIMRKSGDCADVVALLSSMLESLSVTTVALDAPGHLFLMFDTGESKLEALGFPESMVVPYAGTYWIPLEATMVGQPFMESWKQAAELVRRLMPQKKLAMIDIHQAWGLFEPATLPEPESGSRAAAPNKEAVEAKFSADWKAMMDLRWQTSAAQWKNNPLQMGLLAVQFRRYEEAKTYFGKAKQDPTTAAAAYNNLGNLAMLKQDMAGAESNYTMAAQKDPKDAQIFLNLVRLHLKAGRTQKAKEAYEKAMALEPALKEQYPDVASLTP